MINVNHILCYIDPMSGAVVLQLIIGAVVAIGAFFRNTILGGIASVLGKGNASKPSA